MYGQLNVSGIPMCRRPETLYAAEPRKPFQVCRFLEDLQRCSCRDGTGACAARGFPGKTKKPSPPAPAANGVVSRGARGDGGERSKGLGMGGMAARGLVNGRGPRAKRRGRDSLAEATSPCSTLYSESSLFIAKARKGKESRQV